MIYVFHLLDDPRLGDVRIAVRPAHKDYLAAMADRIAFAGPLLGEDGRTMVGSLLAIDFDSLEQARAWLAEEPFTRAGLYAHVHVHAFENLWPQKAGFPPAPAK